MTLKVSTIRPGLLVSLRTSIVGNVKYRTNTLKDVTDGAAHVKEWETTRTVFNKDEHERSVKVRTKMRTCITSVCIESQHGLLCPLDRRQALIDGIAEARKLGDEFNATAEFACIRFNIIVGEVAANDVEAFRAINTEVRDLMQEMKRGIAGLDPKMIRDAATRARNVSNMLTDDMKAKVANVINAVRAEARQIVKAGETAAATVNMDAIAAIEKARTAFLDLDDTDGVKAPVAAGGRAVDFAPAEAAPKAVVMRVRAAPARQLELDDA